MQEFTTAKHLGSFRKELIEVGFSPEEAFALSRDALAHIADEGICVRSEVAA